MSRGKVFAFGLISSHFCCFVAQINGDTMLAYAGDMCLKYAPTSVMSHMSSLKTSISAFDNTDIGQYAAWQLFLNNRLKRYQPNQKPTFEREDIEVLANEGPDEFEREILAILLALFSSARACEIAEMQHKDIHITTSMFTYCLGFLTFCHRK